MKSLYFAAAIAALAGSAAVAGPLTYDAMLSGAAVGSPGTGSSSVTYDMAAHSLFVFITFQGLLAPDTASHIHCCTAIAETGNAGVATSVPTFTGFPSGVMSGTYSHTFDTSLASAWNPAFVTANGGIAGAEAALGAGLAAGKAYVNIHTTAFPGGEIRGFLDPAPEPATFVMAGAALLGLLARRRKRSSSPAIAA
jgi:hypothetical protein